MRRTEEAKQKEKSEREADRFGVLLQCALRYCLSRCSNATDTVVEVLRSFLPTMSRLTLEYIEQDLLHQQRRENGWSNSFDRRMWQSLLLEVQEELRRRKGEI